MTVRSHCEGDAAADLTAGVSVSTCSQATGSDCSIPTVPTTCCSEADVCQPGETGQRGIFSGSVDSSMPANVSFKCENVSCRQAAPSAVDASLIGC